MKSLSHQEKVEFAEKADTSLAYLSQLANGHRKAGLKTMLAIECPQVAVQLPNLKCGQMRFNQPPDDLPRRKSDEL